MGDGGFNPYAAGHKVYKGGLPNAHSGTLDPSGYAERERNKPNGPPSQKRSGLAANLLSKDKKDDEPQKYPLTAAMLMMHGLQTSPGGKLGKLNVND
jgi:hypothetical protein